MIGKIIVICLAAFVAVQAAPPEDRLVGGHEAVKGAFPWQVSVQHGWLSHRHICGGTVLKSRWVLTAGHCITSTADTTVKHFSVLAGIHSLKERGQKIKIKRFIIHPDYKGGMNPNDIALLELAEDLDFTRAIAPIQLPVRDEIPSGQTTLTGWGRTSNGIFPHNPKKLQTVDLPIISNQECSDALIAMQGTDRPLNATNLCTGPLSGGAGFCQGDSGGPLVIRGTNVQVGIVSWGPLYCGTKGAPYVYTRVSAFVDWINSYINCNICM